MTISAAVNIPEEIVVKILSGLPVKSLLRFSCVCKSWWVTINNKNPGFISQHLSRSTLNANGGNLLIISSQQFRGKDTLRLDLLPDVDRGIFKDHKCITPLNIPSSFQDISLLVISSINGLITFHRRFSSKGYTVWNPATGRFRNIPSERMLLDGQLVRRFVGFGVAPGDLNYYKLVSIQIYRNNLKEKGSDVVLIQVYSSLSGSWRVIDAAASTFPTDYDLRIREVFFLRFWRSELGTLANGVLYWILDQKIIVGFNVRDEVFFQLTMPDFPGIQVHVEDCFKLAEIKGSLALIPTSALHGLYYVWEMNERAEAWTKLLLGPPDSKFLWMLGHWKSYLFVVKNLSGKLLIEMPMACPSETREISFFPLEERWIEGAFNYVESLVPV